MATTTLAPCEQLTDLLQQLEEVGAVTTTCSDPQNLDTLRSNSALVHNLLEYKEKGWSDKFTCSFNSRVSLVRRPTTTTTTTTK